MRQKPRIQNLKLSGQKSKNKTERPRKLRLRFALVAMAFLGASFTPSTNIKNVKAESCPDLKVIFIRGSGAEQNTNNDYLTFKSTIEEKLATVDGLSYEFADLDYPAVSVGVDNLSVTAGAWFGAGEAYEFGDSVNAGTKKLTKIVNSSCTNTKYVIGGYSQGAMVLSKALGDLNPERIIYAATFGDPKIYLPEGAGLIPDACRGANLSDYRMYVPDCQAYKGLLGAYVPYEPEAFVGKLGTWCNRRDIFCSSHFNISDHVSYVEDDLYEDASRVIFDKIITHFGIESNLVSPHDTAFLIDSTGSMASMIGRYKAEALRLATETLDAGGRVALYDYRDLADPYTPVEHCNFENCTLESFEESLGEIMADGGGDAPESLLSASFNAMQSLTWRKGATKSLVVLTDADFLSPDRDGVTYEDVINLSKTIDPVNFYIITDPDHADDYAILAQDTDGMVVTDFEELTLLTEYIMGRYDSLPRVEESTNISEKPVLNIVEAKQTDFDEVTITFENSGESAIVLLNDTILGITNETEIKIHNVDFTKQNQIALAPFAGDVRGETVFVRLASVELPSETQDVVVPKVPNTGRQ